MSSLVLSDLAYAFADYTSLFTGLDLTVGPGLTSLVGRNGAGKSTLLRLIAGDLQPAAGSISLDGELPRPPVVAYLPQLLVDAHPERTLAEELGVGARVAALRRIEQGSGSPADFETVGDDWTVAERTVAILDQLGLPTDLSRPVLQLSGGERTLAALAGRVLGRPRVLLLDEPTNNLDAAARSRLFDALADFVVTGDRLVLVVSHDLELLGLVTNTVELRAGKLRHFGGPYAHYREVIVAEQEAALRTRVDARKELRAEKRDREQAQVTLARRERYGRKMEANKREPKIIMGLRKRQAQESAAKYRATHDRGVAQAQERLQASDDAVRREDQLRVDLPDPGLPAGRIVLDTIDPVAGRIHLAGPARVRLVGPNGSGKTTLLRRLLVATASVPEVSNAAETSSADPSPMSPKPHSHDGEVVHVPWAMLEQDLPITRPNRSVVAEIASACPEATTEQVHAHAARFLFTGDAGFRELGELSGGERLRAMLAARLFVRPIPQLLVLDEPTNNLDLDGVEVLAAALAGWRGALLLVSHDDGFCERIEFDEVITLP